MDVCESGWWKRQELLWKLPGKHVSKWTGFISRCKHENYARDTIDGLNLTQQSLLLKSTQRRWIKNSVQHNHNDDNNINDNDDDDVRAEHCPLLSVIFYASRCAHLHAAVNFSLKIKQSWGNYNFMQISLLLVSSFAPSTHFRRHNFGMETSNYYTLRHNTSYRLEIFGNTFCMHYRHYYQKNLSHTNTTHVYRM